MYIIANYFYYSAYLFLLPTSVRLINNNNFSFDKKADVMSHALGWDEIIIITMIIIIIWRQVVRTRSGRVARNVIREES